MLAYQNGVSEGVYISWGYEELYDEYYGQVASIHYREEDDEGGVAGGGIPVVSHTHSGNSSEEVTTNTTWPHGYGVKFYADGSVYVGMYIECISQYNVLLF